MTVQHQAYNGASRSPVNHCRSMQLNECNPYSVAQNPFDRALIIPPMLTPSRVRPPIPSRRHWQRWLLILILLAAWALRLHRLDLQDIWWDEARNIDVATRALTQVATAPELDIHPPLYFYGLHFWAAISGVTRFGLRFFSAWFGMLTLALVYQLGRKTGRSRGYMTGMWAMIVAALAPFALSEAQ